MCYTNANGENKVLYLEYIDVFHDTEPLGEVIFDISNSQLLVEGEVIPFNNLGNTEQDVIKEILFFIID